MKGCVPFMQVLSYAVESEGHMPLKTITVPPRKIARDENEELIYDDKKNPYYLDFYSVVRRALNHPNFMKSYSAVRAGNAVLEELKKLDKDSDEEQTVTLAEEDWKHLKEAVEEPQYVTKDAIVHGLGWPPTIMFQIVPYIEAILNPKNEKDSTK